MTTSSKKMAGSSDRLAFILWEAPLLNNKPLRLFLKTERCHTKYATHVDLPAGCTSTFGSICDFHCAEQGSCPKFCACVAPDAHALANEAPSMRSKRKALRTKVQRALKGGYLRGQILFGILYLDFNLDAAGKFELHQCVDRLGVRAVDVDETLVGRNFELLAALLVDEGRTVDGENALARGEGGWDRSRWRRWLSRWKQSFLQISQRACGHSS